MPRETDTSNTALVAIDFHGDQLLTCQHDGRPFVAMRRVVENIELNWPGQHAKLTSQAAKFSCMDIHTTGGDGKTYVMLAMPVAKLPLWLATINPNKVPDAERRRKIELYQAESAIALHDYWTKGVAVRSDMDGVVTSLDPAAMKALGGMVKAIVHKEMGTILPTLVNETILSSRYAVVEGVSALEVAEMAGYTVGKRPKGTSQFVSRHLNRVHVDQGAPIRRSRHGSGKVKLFDEVTSRRWLQSGGQAELDHYIAQRKGQGKLHLVRPERDRLS